MSDEGVEEILKRLRFLESRIEGMYDNVVMSMHGSRTVVSAEFVAAAKAVVDYYRSNPEFWNKGLGRRIDRLAATMEGG